MIKHSDEDDNCENEVVYKIQETNKPCMYLDYIKSAYESNKETFDNALRKANLKLVSLLSIDNEKI